jgi:hypothetical protein
MHESPPLYTVLVGGSINKNSTGAILKNKMKSTKPQKSLEEIKFEQQMQELAASLLFPLVVIVALLIHFTLSLYHFPSPKTSSFNSHLQGFIPSVFIPFLLFSRTGFFGKYLTGRDNPVRRMVVSFSLLASYMVSWVLVILDKTMLVDRPGVRQLGIIMGFVMGSWFGLLGSSASELMEIAENNGKAMNRKARRQKAKDDSKKEKVPPKKRN